MSVFRSLLSHPMAVVLGLISVLVYWLAPSWLPVWLAIIAVITVIKVWGLLREIELGQADGVTPVPTAVGQLEKIELMDGGWLAALDGYLIVGRGPAEGPTQHQAVSAEAAVEKVEAALETRRSSLKTGESVEVAAITLSADALEVTALLTRTSQDGTVSEEVIDVTTVAGN